MKKRLYKRTSHRGGNASIMALVLLVTLMAMGVIVGAVTIRNHLIEELGDVSVGLDSLDQSYSYTITLDADGAGPGSPVVVSTATYIDDSPTLTDPNSGSPAGIVFETLPTMEQPEGPVVVPPGTNVP